MRVALVPVFETNEHAGHVLPIAAGAGANGSEHRLDVLLLVIEEVMFTTSVQLPSGSTQQQTLKVVQKAEDYFLNNEKQNVESVFATVGSGSSVSRAAISASCPFPA